ncbi:A/G-specific adenine glycosylase [Lachnospiraceae bacterium KM106-2]|nr:A/G-specific adenine glycosylase [Lachnospiraceae bacterium KM106-2]
MSYNYESMVEPLLSWFDKQKRSLAWRDDPKPYYVWVSEIMLQQTRVEAVKGYFDRFIKELPTIADLAAVDDDKLMKLWEGLGYYNRARNLKKAANVVVTEYGGELPANYDSLLSLPGIGSYTAGAISSIAFGLKEPAVDGNVLRVTKRIAGSYDDITKQSVKKELEVDMRAIMPERPGDFNQAIMDLGAMVCIPNGKPLCEKCPLASICVATKKDIYTEIPVKPAKKARKLEDKTVILLEYQGKYAVAKRPKKGLLAGLWEIPNLEGKYDPDDMENLAKELGIKDYELELLGKGKHIFSHIEWHMLGYHLKIKEWEKEKSKITLDTLKEPLPVESYTWVNEEQLEHEYALPNAFDAYKVWK